MWNTTRHDCSPSWLAELQDRLTDVLPQDLGCTDLQQTDIRISGLWLRSIIWQLSTASGCLSSSTPEICMSFRYPIEIAKEVVAITTQSSHQALEILGIGLVSPLRLATHLVLDIQRNY